MFFLKVFLGFSMVFWCFSRVSGDCLEDFLGFSKGLEGIEANKK